MNDIEKFQDVPAYSAGNLPETAKSGAIQTKNEFFTAIRVQVPREISRINQELLEEARLAAESFYYSFQINTKDKKKVTIEGPSIGLISCAVRLFSNCFVDIKTEEEGEYAWIFRAVFVDLEKGYHASRLFRQPRPPKLPLSKSKDLSFAQERSITMSFQAGQSKAIRNVGILGLPNWLVANAFEEAKSTVVASSKGEKGKEKLSRALDYFQQFNIQIPQLEKFLGVKGVSNWGKIEIAKLREIASTVKQDVARMNEIFPGDDEDPEPAHVPQPHHDQTHQLKPDPVPVPVTELKPVKKEHDQKKERKQYDKVEDSIFEHEVTKKSNLKL